MEEPWGVVSLLGLPVSIPFLVLMLVFAYFTYRPMYAWYDAATAHVRLGFYLFGALVMSGSLYLGTQLSGLFAHVSAGIGLCCATLLMLAYKRHLDLALQRAKELEEMQAQQPPPEPEPPKEPTTEEKVEELLRRKK